MAERPTTLTPLNGAVEARSSGSEVAAAGGPPSAMKACLPATAPEQTEVVAQALRQLVAELQCHSDRPDT